MSDTAARITNALAERYVLERELGQGGMATVFLAQDVKHDRQVAFKVLRPELAAVIGAERFLNEIKVTANLQHPHILPLHDSGDADGFLFYVMPYIEGESLRDLLTREKQLGVDDALEITRSIASALDYAHRQGVIHRDIKPENILMHDGQALVADFGIALAVSQASGTRLTETGLSIGTPHYMSPEQAMGDRELDARSDVYSLGAILFEMLTGDPPYTGSTAQAIVAKVITEKAPPVTAVRDTVPAHVGAAIGKALSKMPADRFRSAADFASALANPNFVTPSAVTSVEPAGAVPAARGAGWHRMVWPALTVLFAGLAAYGFLGRGGEGAAGVPSRFLTVVDPPIAPTWGRLVAVSPDGSEIVYVGMSDGRQQLVLRRASEIQARPIPGTDGAVEPVFSPDGEWVAFGSGGDIKRVRTDGGAPLTVAREVYFTGGGGGIHWGGRDEIVFSTSGRSTLGIVPGAGGEVRMVSLLDSLANDADGIQWPHLLPNGRTVLATRFPSLDAASIVSIDIETGTARTIVPEGVFPQYVPSGHIVYGHRSGTIFAVPFDVGSGQVTGQPVAVLEGVQVFSGGATQFAVSASGTVAYLEGASTDLPVFLLRGGAVEPIPVPAGDYSSPRFAPEGDRLALEMARETSGEGVGIFDARARTLTLLSTEESNARYPVWDRTGTWIYYGAQATGRDDFDVFRRRADGSGSAELVFEAPREQYPQDVTRDGSVVIRQNSAESGQDILFLAAGDSVATPLMANAWNEYTPDLSPDERWMAYVSDESGSNEVYVTTFPVPSAKVRISREGGTWPRWSSDGRELFYRTSRGDLVAATIEAGTTVTVAAQDVLFDTRSFQGQWWHTGFDSDPDDSRFAFVGSGDDRDAGITVVVNWFEELRQLMGER